MEILTAKDSIATLVGNIVERLDLRDLSCGGQ